ncbi:MAG TPA: thiamine phosphate synthase [Terriglobales bacterium]
MPDRCLLYYITDRTQFPGDEPDRRRALRTKIAEAARANIQYIQLRERDLSARELEQLAREAAHIIQELRTENRELRTRLLINSRTDIALTTGADGVHLRSDDIAAFEARSVWTQTLARSSQPVARSPVIAVSCHTRADVVRAQSQGADFAVFAPVFEKKDNPAISPSGLAALREACQAKIPVLGLGGVTLDNADSCMKAGAAGIAAIRLFQENRIEDVVRALRVL